VYPFCTVVRSEGEGPDLCSCLHIYLFTLVPLCSNHVESVLTSLTIHRNLFIVYLLVIGLFSVTCPVGHMGLGPGGLLSDSCA
jgi:hypothetical protein